ncbi:MAG: DUF2625 domain-containing protein [Bacteroidota bacterium]
MKPLHKLINKENAAWVLIEKWIKKATNKVDVLARDSNQAEIALYRTQVTTRSTMGAIIYETGGLLVDDGWIRILGSGSDFLKRNLPAWNKGKSFEQYGQSPSFLLVADDAIGGFFALNAGAFGSEDIGKVFYFSPDNLNWESLGVGYSDFLYWSFTGNINQFYAGLRWTGWQEEVRAMGADRAINFYPFLWTEYDDLEKLSRKDVSVEEMWSLQMDIRNQLKN